MNKIKNLVLFKIKTDYNQNYCQKKQIKCQKGQKKVITKDKNGENVSRLETVDVILMYCNVVNSSFQQATEVLFTFVPHRQFVQAITIATHSLTMFRTTYA